MQSIRRWQIRWTVYQRNLGIVVSRHVTNSANIENTWFHCLVGKRTTVGKPEELVSNISEYEEQCDLVAGEQKV